MDHDYCRADDFLGYAVIMGAELGKSQTFPVHRELALGADPARSAGYEKVKGKIQVDVLVVQGAPELTPKHFVRLEAALARLEGYVPNFSESPTITSTQVRLVAQILGFYCEEDIWQVEFNELCDDSFLNNNLDREQLFRALRPRFTGSQVQDVIRELESLEQDQYRSVHVSERAWVPRSRTQKQMDKKSRGQLADEVFTALAGHDSRREHLNYVEILRYAELCGFNGTEQEWSLEWASLCVKEGVIGRDGVQRNQFAELVGKDPYCSDEAELRMMLGVLQNQGRPLADTQKIRSHKWGDQHLKALFDTFDPQQRGTLDQQLARLETIIQGVPEDGPPELDRE